MKFTKCRMSKEKKHVKKRMTGLASRGVGKARNCLDEALHEHETSWFLFPFLSGHFFKKKNRLFCFKKKRQLCPWQVGVRTPPAFSTPFYGSFLGVGGETKGMHPLTHILGGNGLYCINDPTVVHDTWFHRDLVDHPPWFLTPSVEGMTWGRTQMGNPILDSGILDEKPRFCTANHPRLNYIIWRAMRSRIIFLCLQYHAEHTNAKLPDCWIKEWDTPSFDVNTRRRTR